MCIRTGTFLLAAALTAVSAAETTSAPQLSGMRLVSTEKTYGAGQGEIETDAPAHLRTWFVQMPEFMGRIHDAYPFRRACCPEFLRARGLTAEQYLDVFRTGTEGT